MGKFILLSAVLLAGCQQQVRETPKSWKEHCAAAAQVTMDRQMNRRYRQGISGFDAAMVKHKMEKACLKKMRQEQNAPPSKSFF
jgi:hypothetical protein